ncbi:maker366 [Drosophila busckii]|uniref:Maker366 n=1 Tax=Drosophila busckii TaxID=30019 RepID=A0A0M4EKP1_DROBS|nr:maker366 [Drosophila busckii]
MAKVEKPKTMMVWSGLVWSVHPLVQVPNQLVGAPVLTDVTLICNVEASPKAINYWQRENGEMIIAGDRYSLTEKENNMYSIEMILHIKRLQLTDFGGYKCISKNSIGDTEGTIRLYEMEREEAKGHKKIVRGGEEANEVGRTQGFIIHDIWLLQSDLHLGELPELIGLRTTTSASVAITTTIADSYA